MKSFTRKSLTKQSPHEAGEKIGKMSVEIQQKNYRQTPVGIMKVLKWLTQQKLSYILFKCEHIFEGKNKNLDILFERDEEYRAAGRLLRERGFMLRYGEQFEIYKQMHCGLIDGTMYSIHLHREIAWHGMVTLDKQPVFQRARKIHPLIIVPGTEDSILIHAAHVLFENFKVKEREQNYFIKLNDVSTDKDYILWQIRKNHWEKGFWNVVNSNSFSTPVPFLLWLEKLHREPRTMLYLFRKAVRIPLRKLNPKRRGCLIAFIGANGSGKSTLSRKMLEIYAPCTRHLGKEQHYYYYGWNPRFFLTKIGSSLLQKRKKSLFKETALRKDTKQFYLFQELLFLYITVEYLYRYWMDIRPKLRQNSLVVSDRYFYDLYGQYPYAPRSVLLKRLMTIFPKPDFTFILSAPLAQVSRREKTDKNREDKVVSVKRNVLPEDYLKKQQENYIRLRRMLHLEHVETMKDIDETGRHIFNRTWRAVV